MSNSRSAVSRPDSRGDHLIAASSRTVGDQSIIQLPAWINPPISVVNRPHSGVSPSKGVAGEATDHQIVRSSDHQIVPGEARDGVASKPGRASGIHRFPSSSRQSLQNEPVLPQSFYAYLSARRNSQKSEPPHIMRPEQALVLPANGSSLSLVCTIPT